MLKKVKQVSYSPNSSQVHFDPPIQFMDGDDNVATIQLRGELDNSIKAVLRVKPPKGEVIEVEGKTVPYKSIAREFKVPTNIGAVIQSNSQNVNKLYKLIDEDVEISSVEQMKLNDTIFPLANNETVQLEVIKNFEGTVTYETSNSEVATVSTSGLITKKSNGKATITAKCKDNSVSC